jgi:hypothetical protein
MLRLITLWLGVFSLIMHAPAHAVGKERVVGVPSCQPARLLIADYQSLAAHLPGALNRPVFAASADAKPDTLAKLQRALLSYQAPNGMHTALLASQDLESMDPYLDQTRRRLKHTLRLTTQVKP